MDPSQTPHHTIHLTERAMILNKEYLGNSKFLFDLYENNPSFEGIAVQEIKFGWNGPIARLIFSLRAFPPSPPMKWQSLNTIQIELSLFPLYQVNLVSFGRKNRCDLTIERAPDEDALIIQLTGDSVASFKAMTVTIDKVSAYLCDT